MTLQNIPPVLSDTCVIIENLKNVLPLSESPCINAVIEMELIQGARNKRELNQIKSYLNNFKSLPLEQTVFDLAIQLVEAFALSHNLRLADAVIAATALVYDVELHTVNLKDFRFIPGLKLFAS